VEGIVVLDKTPSTPRWGPGWPTTGQIVIAGDRGVCFEVTDVQKNKGGKYMHYGRLWRAF
jgi:alanyl-tRNA synthetase